MSDASNDKPADWNNRELCPDGACVGVIGRDGRCSVCGNTAPGWSERAVGDAAAPAPDPDPEHEPDQDEPAARVEREGEIIDAEASDGRSGDDWDQRTLCPDGGCTGVIEAGGTCSVCARTAAEIAGESATSKA